MKPQNTTIYTLSKAANVSPSTVSKALNNSVELSAEMRQRIQSLATQMNFRPRTVRRRTMCVGVLIQQYPGQPLDFSVYLSAILEGVAEYCHDEGIAMSMIAASVDELNQYDIVKEIARRGIDGVVVVRSNEQSDYLGDLEKNHFPYCVVNGDSPGSNRLAISTDFYAIGRRAAEHLLELGHRRLGIIVSPSDATAGIKRLAGFREAVDCPLVVVRNEEMPPELRDGFDCGREGVNRILAADPAVTAIFATGFEPCVGAMQRLRELHYAIPADLSLLSCDEYRVMSYLSPGLSTVSVPIKPLGYLAAKQVHRLLRELEPFDPADQLCLQGELVTRTSTGQAPDCKNKNKNVLN